LLARQRSVTGIPIARAELLDEMQVRVGNVCSKLALPEQPTLFIEFHGTPVRIPTISPGFTDIISPGIPR
jgi:D-lactate dehydrogenase (cytochrome)